MFLTERQQQFIKEAQEAEWRRRRQEDPAEEFTRRMRGLWPVERPSTHIDQEAIRQLQALQTIEDRLVMRISREVVDMLLPVITDLLKQKILEDPVVRTPQKVRRHLDLDVELEG